MAGLGVSRAEFAPWGAIPGTRRPFIVPVTATPESALVYQSESDSARLEFQLPAGVYATVLLDTVGVTTDTEPRGA